MNHNSLRSSFRCSLRDARRMLVSGSIKAVGMAVVSAALMAQSTTPPTISGDTDVLNYLLALNYMEASYYNQFLGTGTNTTTGVVGTVTGNPPAFTSAVAPGTTSFAGQSLTVRTTLTNHLN